MPHLHHVVPLALAAALATAPAPPVSPPSPVSRPAPWLRPWAAWSGGAALTAVLALASVVLLVQPTGAPMQARSGEFLPLVPREDWPDEASPAWLVASELPPERLAALGLPYDPAPAAAPVRAELLVHPSGVVLALRLID